MSFLLLGVDSLIACVAICAIVSPRARLPLAALFGVADGVIFLIGAGVGWRLPGGVTEFLETGTLVALGLYLLVVAAGIRGITARWPLFILPWALTMDNLTHGLINDSAGALLQQAGQQALSSAVLALVGLLVAVALPVTERRAAATRFAGGALVVAAGGLALLG